MSAIPSEYTCLKKIVTPSDQDLKMARISIVSVYTTTQHTVGPPRVNRQHSGPRHARSLLPRCASRHQRCDSWTRPSPHKSWSQREDGIAPAPRGFHLRFQTLFAKRRRTAAWLSVSGEWQQTGQARTVHVNYQSSSKSPLRRNLQ